jgi:protease-4
LLSAQDSLDELRQALVDFRSSGKSAVAFAEMPANGEYYLASACDYIIIVPNGYLGLVGLKAEGMFLKGTMDKLGLEAKYTKVGKYKSAVEALTVALHNPSKDVRFNAARALGEIRDAGPPCQWRRRLPRATA